MLQLNSKDFSFVGEHHVGQLYHLFEKIKIKPNLTQNGAISFVCVVDNQGEKTERLAMEAAGIFDTQVTKELSLLTIRHYTGEFFDKLTAGRTILLKQQTPETVQVLMQ
jgi:aspartate kinase